MKAISTVITSAGGMHYQKPTTDRLTALSSLKMSQYVRSAQCCANSSHSRLACPCITSWYPTSLRGKQGQTRLVTCDGAGCSPAMQCRSTVFLDPPARLHYCQLKRAPGLTPRRTTACQQVQSFTRQSQRQQRSVNVASSLPATWVCCTGMGILPRTLRSRRPGL